MARITQRKRRRRARESSANVGSASESEDASSSDDDSEEAEEQRRRWRTRRAAQDTKGKGKELVKEEDEEEDDDDEVILISDDEEEAVDGKEEDVEDGVDRSRPRSQDCPSQTADQICGICLTERGNERGKLDCCDHFFCFACIMEWAKVESRCPMCKQRFLTVTRPAVSRSRSRSVRIPTRDQVYEPSEEEIRLFTDPYQNTVCTECQEAGDEGLLLLCDRCDGAAHTYCVGLGRSVPRGDWYCEACHALEGESSGEEDDEDFTFDAIDGEEEEGSGSESVLAMLVADLEPNLFAGRTRRSHRPPPLRRSARRRARRRSLTDPPTLSEALIGMSSRQGRRHFPDETEPYAARTLYHQRRVQATVQNRLQNIRENWNRLRSGEMQFTAAGLSAASSGPASENGDFPSSSTPGVGDLAGRSMTNSVTTMDGDGREASASSRSTRGAMRSAESGDINRAWANMNRAIRLEGAAAGSSQPGTGSQAGSASDRRSRDTKMGNTPVSARTRERLLGGGVHSRVTRGERLFHTHGQTGTDNSREGFEFYHSRNSNSRDSDGSKDSRGQSRAALEGKPASGRLDDSYHLREISRPPVSRAFTGFASDNATSYGGPMVPYTWQNHLNRRDAEDLGVLTVLDDKDNSVSSGGVCTRSRDAKEKPGLHLSSILGEGDNSRGSVGVTTRNREARALQLMQGKGILDDKDSSRGSTGATTKDGIEYSRSQSKDRPSPRNLTGDAEMKLMKEQCNNLVQIALQPILKKGTIDKTQHKEVARSATHTILSSLGVQGLKHCTDVVPMGTVICHHDEPISSSLIPGCCTSCMQRHVVKCVKGLVKEKIHLHK